MSVAHATDLSTSVLDLEYVRANAARAIARALKSVRGRKALVLDPLLLTPLQRLCNLTRLTRECDVDRTYSLEGGTVETRCAEIVFVVKPRVALMKTLAEVVRAVREDAERARRAHARKHAARDLAGNLHAVGANLLESLTSLSKTTADVVSSSGSGSGASNVPPPPATPSFTVFFLPCETEKCLETLERAFVLNYLRVGAIPWTRAIPLERDVILVDGGGDERWRSGDGGPGPSSDDSSGDGAGAGSSGGSGGGGAGGSSADAANGEGITAVARALHDLQRVFGTAPIVKGKGRRAAKVSEAMERLRREAHEKETAAEDGDGMYEDGEEEGDDAATDDIKEVTDGPRPLPGGYLTPVNPRVDVVVLLDRDVDAVTPLCTQLTYEGLIDEIIGIENDVAVIPAEEDETSTVAEEDGTPPVARPEVRARLNSNDALFRELRDVNFGRACDLLKMKSSSMRDDYRVIKEGEIETQEVKAIGGFVRAIKGNIHGVGLDLHTTIAKHLLDSTRGADEHERRFMSSLEIERMCVEGKSADACVDKLEEMIAAKENVRRVVRLLALISLCHGGVAKERVDALKKAMFQSYGAAVLMLLLALEQRGYLRRKEDWHAANKKSKESGHGGLGGLTLTRRAFKLVADDVDVASPKDVSFAYSHSGYAPLSVRVCERAVDGPWNTGGAAEDALRELPGPAFEYAQGYDDDGAPAVKAANYAGFEKKRARAIERQVAESGGDGDGDAARRGQGGDDTQGARVPGAWRDRRPVVLVVFLGGVTRTEVSCLRFASDSVAMRRGVDFVVAATKITSGWGVVSEFIAPDDANFERMRSLKEENEARAG